MAFVVKFIEKKAPAGLDLLGNILIAAPLTRLIGNAFSPIVDATLLNIGGIIKDTTSASPILMGIILGELLQ